MAEEVIGLLFGVDGSGSIDGRSGRQIVGDLTKIVNQINSGKSTVPKVQLKFDTSHAKKALQELKSQLQEIASMGNISVSGVSSRGGSGGSAGVKQDTANYRALTTTVKQYYAALAEAEKIQMKTTSVSSSDGVWSTTDAQYDARIQKINQLKTQFDSLGVSVNAAGVVEMNSAQQLNITEEQRAMLLTQVQSAITANGIAHEKSAAQISATWDKNAAKVHEYILRMQDVASKNAEVNALMTELNALAASGNPQNLDELTAKFAQLQQKVRETNADVQTFGQKLSKTFGSQLRYMLTSMVYMKALQFIRDLYNNVVELDKAMVNLQIASGKTREATKELVKEYADLAKTLGATTAEVADAADTWLRQGYSTEEANTLITNSMMLSKLGQMESAEASKALTSAMKGYGVAVEDSVQIVDKLTKVDMEAAASAGDIATAMAETATSAKLSGVSMDALIGYITTVKEVTQDGSESVGVFFKTLFARMNNVAAGKFIDDETGESLNDVEAVLGNLGIALRGVNGEFRNSSDVLDDVAARWDTFNDTERNAIATAMAGARNFEKFNVLMNNYGTAMKYAETSTKSAGTAIEKFSDYTSGIEAAFHSLQASFEKFSMTFLDSELIVGFANFLGGIVEFLNMIASVADGMLVTIPAITLSLVALRAILLRIKATQAFMAMAAGLKGILAIFPAILAQARAWVLSLKAQALGHTMTTAALNAQAAATQAATAAQTAMNATNPIGWIMLAVTAIYALVKAIGAAGTAWKDSYERAKKAADEQEALVEEYDSEIDSLESLRAKLIDAQGNRQKLAGIYDELNSKIAVSSALLRGEESAYKSAEAQIQDLIKAKKALREEALKEKLEQERSAFENNKASRYGLFGLDFLALDALGENMRGFMRGTFSNSVDYDVFYNQWDTEYQDSWLKTNGFTRESWDTYWKAQVDTANEVFSSIIYDADGVFNDDFMSSVVERLIRGGYNLDETYAVLNELKNNSPELNQKISQYYEELMSGSDSAPGTYGEIQDIFDGYIEQYPALEKLFTSLFASIRTEKGSIEGITVELKSINDVFDETQKGFDGLVSAMSDVTSEGYLTANALASLAKLEEDGALAGLELADILTQDANGYKLAEDALQKYVQALISAYTVEGTFASQKDKENAIANLENLRSVLATLMATQEESTDANKAYREELEKEQDMYEDQLNKFEELIDLRKDLLQTYKEELDYQKELEKRQRNVTALQTKLSVARLDQSAAGQARVRELEAELKSAQEDLEDFTLEHAIDVLTDQLESTNAEWKAIIQGKLDKITQLLGGLDNTPYVNVNVDTSWMQSAMASIAWYEHWYSQNPDADGSPPPMPDGWTLPTLYSTVQEYRDAIKGLSDDMVADNKANGRPDAYAVSTQQWQARYLSAMSTSDIATAKAAYEWLRSYYTSITGKAPNYHTGGLVGDIATLSSSEEFAKLLKGEFVSTPAQMKRFMEETLPKIANYSAAGGSNEFNAPLIEITCESVTTEALPELERIVNEAVKEIKRELDSGMSRTGFKRTPAKRLT